MDFMVDTGASVVALTERDAGRLGLRPAAATSRSAHQTANGTVNAAPKCGCTCRYRLAYMGRRARPLVLPGMRAVAKICSACRLPDADSTVSSYAQRTWPKLVQWLSVFISTAAKPPQRQLAVPARLLGLCAILASFSRSP